LGFLPKGDEAEVNVEVPVRLLPVLPPEPRVLLQVVLQQPHPPDKAEAERREPQRALVDLPL